jgi:gamma-glutamyl-gamma-aminobutyrate hydrolase PuuD
LGGSLHPHLPDTLSNIHRGLSRDVNHPIEIVKNIGVFEINVADISDPVSNHHQGISRLAEDLEVWAIAPDGLAEGVRHKDTIAYPFFIGVQWHPERSGDVNSLAIPIGEGFLKYVLNYE